MTGGEFRDAGFTPENPQNSNGAVSAVNFLKDAAVFRTLVKGFDSQDKAIAKNGLRAYTLFGREFDESPSGIGTIIDRRLEEPDQPYDAADFSTFIDGLEGFATRPIVEAVPTGDASAARPRRAKLVRHDLSLGLVVGYRKFENIFKRFGETVKPGAVFADRQTAATYVMGLCELTAPDKWGEISLAPLSKTPPASVFNIDPFSQAYLAAVLRQRHIVDALHADPAFKDGTDDPEQLRETLGTRAIAIGNILLNASAPVSRGQIAAAAGLRLEEVDAVFKGPLGNRLKDAASLELSTARADGSYKEQYRIIDRSERKRRLPATPRRSAKPKQAPPKPPKKARKTPELPYAEARRQAQEHYRDFLNALLTHCDRDAVHEGENLAKLYREELGWSDTQWSNYTIRFRKQGYITTTLSEGRISKIEIHPETVDQALAEDRLLPLSPAYLNASETLAARFADKPAESEHPAKPGGLSGRLRRQLAYEDERS